MTRFSLRTQLGFFLILSATLLPSCRRMRSWIEPKIPADWSARIWPRDRDESREPIDSQSAREKLMRENAERLVEVVTLLFGHRDIAGVDYGEWVDSMMSGNGFNGMMQGLLLGRPYRDREAKFPGPHAKCAARYLSWAQTWQFSPDDQNRLLETPLRPELLGDATKPASEAGSSSVVSQSQVDSGVDEVVFSGAPALSDRAKTVESPSPSPVGRRLTQSCFGYRRAILQLVSERLDQEVSPERQQSVALEMYLVAFTKSRALVPESFSFGLPIRDNPDVSFHRKWAEGARVSSLVGEIYNRLLRTLNEGFDHDEPKWKVTH